MFELSHRLIGIYKTSNQTRSELFDIPFNSIYLGSLRYLNR